MSEDGDGLTLEELHERNKPPETTPVSVRLPESLLEDLDGLWEVREFDNRSEFIRAALRYITDNPGEFPDLDGSGRDRRRNRRL